MRDILLINPNTSTATTAMMVRLAALEAAPGWRVLGAAAGEGPGMIVEQAELERSAVEVERTWLAHARTTATPAEGVIVGAFGDPGIGRLRAVCAVPVIGLCESSMQEAAAGGRRFGIATVTPGLVRAIDGLAVAHGFAAQYTGIQLTPGEPRALAADPRALEEALAEAVARCIERDGAEAVIIGGGPLGQAAAALGPRFAVPVIAPITAAMRRLSVLLRSD
ncbi:aspartate/glutamate racemase family protein [Xylophilus rhododendri]|uniref:Aspartate/glutamate racemase family protein n=1 Tax=Xylophilus rhododendri TaxID=2697032 RepID=A0A857J1L0_9BURK|nr:aspartate/glutamate racemase family protein [Xylophilus rhododendri]QHI97804.1 aspartate/glutamate racemase family protein [Xylophilus rhododendri]